MTRARARPRRIHALAAALCIALPLVSFVLLLAWCGFSLARFPSRRHPAAVPIQFHDGLGKDRRIRAAACAGRGPVELPVWQARLQGTLPDPPGSPRCHARTRPEDALPVGSTGRPPASAQCAWTPPRRAVVLPSGIVHALRAMRRFCRTAVSVMRTAGTPPPGVCGPFH